MTTHRELLRLVKVPIDSFEEPLTILKLNHMAAVYEMFDYAGRKSLACHLVQAIVSKLAYITTADQVTCHCLLHVRHFVIVCVSNTCHCLRVRHMSLSAHVTVCMSDHSMLVFVS